jgi:hypothetical protein
VLGELTGNCQRFPCPSVYFISLTNINFKSQILHFFAFNSDFALLSANLIRIPFETWWLSLRKECWLRVFENRVLQILFGPKRDKLTGEWRRLHNERLYALYTSPSIIRVIKSRITTWAGHVARTKNRRGTYRVLVGIPEGKRPTRRPRRRWKENITMDLRGV